MIRKFFSKQFFGLYLILFLFLILQIAYIATSAINSDNALVGLAALDILEGKLPVFTYGQSFMGTIEAYLTAVIFLIFGVSGFTLQIAPVLFALGFCLVVYLLGWNLLGHRWALLVLFLIAFGPPYFQSYCHAARGGYIETLFFGTLLIFTTVGIISKNKDFRWIFALYFFWGLVAGVGFWTNPLVVSYLIVCGFFIFLKDKKIFFKPEFFLGLAGFFLGSAPFWVFNWQQGFRSFFSLGQATGVFSAQMIKQNFVNIFFNQLPKILGLAWSAPFQILGKIFYLAFLGIYFYLVFKFRKEFLNLFKRPPGEKQSFLIFLILVPLVLFLGMVSHFGSFEVARYLLPIYSTYPFLLVFFIKEKWPRYKYFLTVFFGVIFLFNGFYVVNRLSPAVIRKSWLNQKSSQEAINFLTDRQINTFYADYWIMQRLYFLSHRRLVGSTFSPQRLRANGTPVNASRNPAFIFEADPFFEMALRSAGGQFKKTVLNFPGADLFYRDYFIFYDFQPSAQSYQEIFPEHLSISASCNTGAAQLVCDRNVTTFWGGENFLQPGEFLILDLKKIYRVGKLEILTAPFSELKGGSLGGYQLCGSVDGGTWKILSERPQVLAPLFWSGPHPFWSEENGRISLVFTPQPVRFLKIIQTGRSRRNRWIIRELFVYTPAGFWPNNTWQTEPVLKFLEENQAHFVLADYWLSSVIQEKTAGRIKVIPAANEVLFSQTADFETYRIFKLVPGTFFVIKPDESAALEKFLKNYSGGYKKAAISGWLIYYDINLKSFKIPEFFWSGTHVLKV